MFCPCPQVKYDINPVSYNAGCPECPPTQIKNFAPFDMPQIHIPTMGPLSVRAPDFDIDTRLSPVCGDCEPTYFQGYEREHPRYISMDRESGYHMQQSQYDDKESGCSCDAREDKKSGAPRGGRSMSHSGHMGHDGRGIGHRDGHRDGRRDRDDFRHRDGRYIHGRGYGYPFYGGYGYPVYGGYGYPIYDGYGYGGYYDGGDTIVNVINTDEDDDYEYVLVDGVSTRVPRRRSYIV